MDSPFYVPIYYWFIPHWTEILIALAIVAGLFIILLAIRSRRQRSKGDGDAKAKPVTWVGAAQGFAAIAALIISLVGVLNGPNAGLISSYEYSASTPGPQCDKGPGEWNDGSVQVSCSSTGASVALSNGTGFGYVIFFGDRTLPNNQLVQVDVGDMAEGICAGVLTRISSAGTGGYGFLICNYGNIRDVYITRYKPDGEAENIRANIVSQQDVYTLIAISTGATQKLEIDGNIISQVDDLTYPTTYSVSLIVTSNASPQGVATFGNFVFKGCPNAGC